MINTSIIIPVFNDELYLKKTLDAIMLQVGDDSSVEIIVIDNGSTDNSVDLVKAFPGIKVLIEKDHLNSPYSCRNRGIEISSGENIVLLDSTCVPDKEWLKNGIACLNKPGVDIVGGNVLFDFEGKLTAGKIYDSLTNIRMKESIEIRKVAKTANLFIKKDVISKIGAFPEGVRSGADVRWTHKATQAGFNIVFCESSIVLKPARDFIELVKKQWRVGIHQPIIWKEQNKKVSIASRIKQLISPVSPSSFKSLLKKKGTPDMEPYYFKLIVVAQIVHMVMALANIKGLITLRRNE